MNMIKLKEAEERFFTKYPGGFSNPLLQDIAKKHKIDKMKKELHPSLHVDNASFCGFLMMSIEGSI